MLRSGLVCLGVLLLALSARAHDTVLWAEVIGGEVRVEAYSTDGDALANTPVSVHDEQGEAVAEGFTDENGRFRFRAAGPATLTISVDPGSDHQTSETLVVE
ncbi:MAG: carboxypeptidase-like regulatory domain-containing protein [Geminicoccaceae bacterium]